MITFKQQSDDIIKLNDTAIEDRNSSRIDILCSIYFLVTVTKAKLNCDYRTQNSVPLVEQPKFNFYQLPQLNLFQNKNPSLKHIGGH